MVLEGIIYKYISPSYKIYIGQTTNEEIRRSEFLNLSKTYAGCKMEEERRRYPNLQEWKYEVLIHISACDYKTLHEKLDFYEAKYILEYDSIKGNLNSAFGNNHNTINHNKLFIDYILTKLNDNLILRYFDYLEHIYYDYSIENENQNIWTEHNKQDLQLLNNIGDFYKNCKQLRKVKNQRRKYKRENGKPSKTLIKEEERIKKILIKKLQTNNKMMNNEYLMKYYELSIKK